MYLPQKRGVGDAVPIIQNVAQPSQFSGILANASTVLSQVPAPLLLSGAAILAYLIIGRGR